MVVQHVHLRVDDLVQAHNNSVCILKCLPCFLILAAVEVQDDSSCLQHPSPKASIPRQLLSIHLLGCRCHFLTNGLWKVRELLLQHNLQQCGGIKLWQVLQHIWMLNDGSHQCIPCLRYPANPLQLFHQGHADLAVHHRTSIDHSDVHLVALGAHHPAFSPTPCDVIPKFGEGSHRQNAVSKAVIIGS